MITFMRLGGIMGKQRKREPPAGLSVAETARILGLRPQRVYQLQTAGLRKLKKGLAARGYTEEAIPDLPGWLTEYIFSEIESSE